MPERRFPVSVTRCNILVGFGATLLTGSATAAYAVGIEPLQLSIASYRIRPLGPWRTCFSLRIVALFNLHACEPWMSARCIDSIVQAANALTGDVTFLLGHYVAGMRAVIHYLGAAEWVPTLGKLSAPLGVHAILGNHDWWEDRSAQKRGHGPTIAGTELTKEGVYVLENDAVPLSVRGHEVWLAGLTDQIDLAPFARKYGRPRKGLGGLGGTLARIPDGAPAILLAHEPNIFPMVPARVALTLSRHPHCGQVRAFGCSPVVPSRYGNRYAYGHVCEQADLVVSSGLAMGIASIRFGVPAVITIVELVGEAVS